MQLLLTMPGGSEWIFVFALIIPWAMGIIKILQREQNAILKIALVLLAVFVPPFSIIYLVYALVASSNKVLVQKN